MQKKLPQILLVRSQALDADTCERLERESKSNIKIIRMNRAWATETAIKEAFILLRVALFEFRLTHEFIIYTDAFRSHLTKGVWRCAGASRVQYCIIPALLTWALQPCDTHAIGGYKRVLLLLWSRRYSHNSRLAMSLAEVICCIDTATITYLETERWCNAFNHVGLVGHQELVSWNTLDKLGFADVPPTTKSLPTLKHLMDIFPAGSILPLDDMFLYTLQLS